MKSWGFTAIIAMVLVVAGCSSVKDEPSQDECALTFDGEVVVGDSDSLVGGVQDRVQSRAGSMFEAKTTFVTGDRVGVLAYKTPISWATNKVGPSYAYNRKLTFLTRSFSCETPIFYPNDGSKVTIIAYYPYLERPEDNTGNFWLGGQFWNGAQPIYYRVNPDPAKHVDLMCAHVLDLNHPVPGAPDTYIGLVFEHALTNVRFSANMINQSAIDLGFTAQVNKVTIAKASFGPYVYGYMMYDPGIVEPFAWSRVELGDLSIVNDVAVINSTTPLLLASTLQIPQSMNADIHVNYTIFKRGVKVDDFTAVIPKAHYWTRGKVINYQMSISPKDNNITISSSIEAWKNGNEISGTI